MPPCSCCNWRTRWRTATGAHPPSTAPLSTVLALSACLHALPLAHRITCWAPCPVHCVLINCIAAACCHAQTVPACRIVYERAAVEEFLRRLPASKRGRAIIMAGGQWVCPLLAVARTWVDFDAAVIWALSAAAGPGPRLHTRAACLSVAALDRRQPSRGGAAGAGARAAGAA